MSPPTDKETPMHTQTSPIAGTFVADKDHSSALFTVQHMKVSRFRASFTDIDARLTGSDAELSLEGSARVASISITNPPIFRAHVVDGVDFFNVRLFPEIGFRSTDFRLDADGTATVEGELTINDITRPVTAAGALRGPVADIAGGQSASLELTASLDRREWGLDWQMPLPDGENVLGWHVELAVNLELRQNE
jgi:polyisoprenoid-binding protein YceI